MGREYASNATAHDARRTKQLNPECPRWKVRIIRAEITRWEWAPSWRCENSSRLHQAIESSDFPSISTIGCTCWATENANTKWKMISRRQSRHHICWNSRICITSAFEQWVVWAQLPYRHRQTVENWEFTWFGHQACSSALLSGKPAIILTQVFHGFSQLFRDVRACSINALATKQSRKEQPYCPDVIKAANSGHEAYTDLKLLKVWNGSLWGKAEDDIRHPEHSSDLEVWWPDQADLIATKKLLTAWRIAKSPSHPGFTDFSTSQIAVEDVTNSWLISKFNEIDPVSPLSRPVTNESTMNQWW